MTNECSGAGLPDAVYAQDGLLEAMIQMIYQREAFKLQSNGSSWSKLAMGPFADHLRRIIAGPSGPVPRLASMPLPSGPRFSLFAAHDTTLNPFLSALLGDDYHHNAYYFGYCGDDIAS